MTSDTSARVIPRLDTSRLAVLAVPALLWAAAIAFGSGKPALSTHDAPLSHLGPWQTGPFMFHSFEFGLLAILLAPVALAISGRGSRLALGCVAVAAITVMLVAGSFGALDEIHQSFVPGRDSAIVDLFADLTGAAVGLSIFMLSARFGRRASP